MFSPWGCQTLEQASQRGISILGDIWKSASQSPEQHWLPSKLALIWAGRWTAGYIRIRLIGHFYLPFGPSPIFQLPTGESRNPSLIVTWPLPFQTLIWIRYSLASSLPSASARAVFKVYLCNEVSPRFNSTSTCDVQNFPLHYASCFLTEHLAVFPFTHHLLLVSHLHHNTRVAVYTELHKGMFYILLWCDH